MQAVHNTPHAPLPQRWCTLLHILEVFLRRVIGGWVGDVPLLQNLLVLSGLLKISIVVMIADSFFQSHLVHLHQSMPDRPLEFRPLLLFPKPFLPMQPPQDPQSVEDEIFWFGLGSVIEEEELGDSKKMKAENNLDLLIVSELGLEVPSKIEPCRVDLFADPISDEGHSHF